MATSDRHDPSMPRGRWRLPGYQAAAVLIAVHGSGSVLYWGDRDTGVGHLFAVIMGDLGLAVAAGLAGAACFTRAFLLIRFYRMPCYRCYSWMLAGSSCLAAAIGNGVWSWYELVDQTAPPSPSAADWCFLGFGPLALAALLAAHGDRIGAAERIRLVLDTVLIAGSLFSVAWVAALAIATAHITSPMKSALVLGYPVFDLVLVSLLIALRTRTPDKDGGIGTGVRIGYLVIVVCDSIFTVPGVHAGYRSGGLLDTGWFAGYLLIAAAATTGDRTPRGGDAGLAGFEGPAERGDDGDEREPGAESAHDDVYAMIRDGAAKRRVGGVLAGLRIARVILPYLAAGMCLAGVLADGLERDHEMDPVLLVAASAVLVALISRQAMTLWENQRLAEKLRAAAATLAHHAYHDELTGLPNRVLLTDRLEHALTQRAAEWEPVAVLFLDLDGFKAVNDSAGHGTGDQVLIEAARRLTETLRVGDTVARFGGDEFVAVLEIGTPADGARLTAERLLTVLSVDYRIGAGSHLVGASIGLAFSEPGGSAAELLRRADAAMYAAKSAGKGRVHAEPVSSAWVGVADPGTIPAQTGHAGHADQAVPNGETATIIA
jgi:diguanylate cyclase (GGDEF)-like protein